MTKNDWLGGVAIVLALSGCAETHYARPATTTDEFVSDYLDCRVQAMATPPSYQMGLPEYGYGYPYGRPASAGSGAGLLAVVLLERATTKAQLDERIKRCLVAKEYQPM